ncbi:MAG: MATE family efflux transporter [Treponema sp.]|nr:MATE family efflux transporter [Treponema sp.]
MKKNIDTTMFFKTERVSKILFKLAPPIMLAQLIQALYNIVDSLFIGKFSNAGLTALSIIYPLQLLMIALAAGTGVGINTIMAAKLGEGNKGKAYEFAGVGTPLAVILWFLFALTCYLFMPSYARMSTNSEEVIKDVIAYGRIVCVFSFGLFLESIWTKVLQAFGDMKTPMLAQIAGAIVNILIDPALIFGMFGLPKMGIKGAAIATVIGQITAALIVAKKGFRKAPDISLFAPHIARIFRLGLPNIIMQSAYTFYIFGLNMILATFSDQAVTALGLYYKWQTFFFIPLGAMQTCIVPVISFNYAARNIGRCRKTLFESIYFGLALMAVGTLCFLLIPAQMLSAFTTDQLVISIGKTGFMFIGVSFLPMVTSLIFPVFFQAVGASLKSSLLTVIRTVVLFVPLGFIFSRFGLTWFWLTYPVTEFITTIAGFIYFHQFMKKDYVQKQKPPESEEKDIPALKPSSPGVIITIAREHGSSGRQIGKLVAQKLGIPFYYKDMIALAAHESGLDREFISNIHRNAPSYLYTLYMSSHVVRFAMRAQNRIIRKIADSGSCVIVGRAADHVLKDYEGVIRVFVHAPEDVRIKRVMESYGDTLKEAKKNIRHSDKSRATYYKHISGLTWGNVRNYELTVNSALGIEPTADAIVQMAKRQISAGKQ